MVYKKKTPGFAYLVVDALVEQDTEGPPVGTNIIAVASIDLRGQVSQRSRFTGQPLAGDDI